MEPSSRTEVFIMEVESWSVHAASDEAHPVGPKLVSMYLKLKNWPRVLTWSLSSEQEVADLVQKLLECRQFVWPRNQGVAT